MDVDLPAHIKFWLTEANNDCYFVVGPTFRPTERIGALKVFLVGHSEPFRVMFGHSALAEKGDVRVIDVDPETFKIFLRCVYGGSDLILPKLSFQSCAKLLYVAEKYLVDDLKAKIVSELSAALTPKTVFQFLKYPICLKSEALEKEILRILQSELEQIMMDGYKLSGKSLFWFVQQSDLNVEEIKIWELVLKWAMYNTNSSDGKILRHQMYPFLKHIRFLSMCIWEFCQNVVPKDVLTKEEVYEICRAFGTNTPPGFKHLCHFRNSRINTPATAKLTINSLIHSQHVVVLASANTVDLKEKEFSKPFHFNGCTWSIGAWKKPDEYYTGHHLVLYLKCDLKDSDHSYSVTGEFSVLHESDESFTSYFGHTLNNVNSTCSVRFNWADLTEGGYIKYKKVVVSVHFTGI